MKRKVKFQEGGMVETPSQRRVRLSESVRDRSAEFRDAMRREAAARAADQRAVAQFNERMNRAMPVTPAEARALGAEPVQRPMNPRPNVAQRIPAAAGAVARGASRAIPGMNVVRGVTPTSLQAGADFEQEGLRQVRMADERSRMEQELGEAGQRMPTSPPAAAPAPRPAPTRRPVAPASREISADRLNDLMMGAEPTTAEERAAQMRMRSRQQELEEKGTAFRKGGMVKQKTKPVAKKAGGMVAAKPKPAAKKMMKGGIVSKPKSKAKPMTAMKRGGMVKKGKK